MKLLVPLDGSALSTRVLPWVKLLCSKCECEVELFRSFMPLVPAVLIPELTAGGRAMLTDDAVETRIKEYLDEQAEGLEGLNVSTVCGMGPAADAIVGRSKEVDLTVIASHGESGITRWLLGSVTTKVLRASETAVMVVGAAPEEEPRPAKIQSILVPLDGSLTSEVAIPKAAEMARKFEAKITLFESITYRNTDTTRLQDDWQVIESRDYLRKQAAKLEAQGLEVQVHVHKSANGPPIADYANENDVDLVVMASHGQSGFSRWFVGSVTEGVVQRAGCPVMVVRAELD